MSVYEIANQLVLKRAPECEVHMVLFAMLADYFWAQGTIHSMRDIREFARITAIPTPMVNEIRLAALMAFV